MIALSLIDVVFIMLLLLECQHCRDEHEKVL